MDALPLWLLILVFVAGAVVIWFAGIQLSKTTDILDARLHLGSALGGLIVLAVATNLPEIAITVTAAVSGSIGVAVGNILGGIALQTVVIAVLDAFGKRGRGVNPLTYRAASLGLVLEAIVVAAVLAVVMAGSQLPSGIVFLRVSPDVLLIAAVWVIGLLLVQRAGHHLPWHENGAAPDASPHPHGHRTRSHQQHAGGTQPVGNKRAGGSSSHGGKQQPGGHKPSGGKQQPGGKQQSGGKAAPSTAKAAVVFAISALATLVAGVAVEQAGDAASSRIGLSGVLFGATVLALATSLPEISTGLQAVRQGDDNLAISDIFGGNAFLPVLFLVATVISGRAVLPQANASDVYLTALAALLTVVYAVGLLFRPRRRILGMGVDSFVVVALYLLGVVGLIAIAL